MKNIKYALITVSFVTANAETNAHGSLRDKVSAVTQHVSTGISSAWSQVKTGADSALTFGKSNFDSLRSKANSASNDVSGKLKRGFRLSKESAAEYSQAIKASLVNLKEKGSKLANSALKKANESLSSVDKDKAAKMAIGTAIVAGVALIGYVLYKKMSVRKPVVKQ